MFCFQIQPNLVLNMISGISSLSTLLVLSSVACHFREVLSFGVLPQSGARRGSATLDSLTTSALSDAFMDGENRRRMSEFSNLEPLPETDLRRKRIELDRKLRGQFAEYGNDLWDLRSAMNTLSVELVRAMTSGIRGDEKKARKSLRKAEKRDPELVYKLELEAAERAEREGRLGEAGEHKEKALAARSFLPQFNLEGLWVGKYGKHGYEMINVTYVGDMLIAYKVTGDNNVPRGEITFQADLSPIKPRFVNGGERKGEPSDLQPIVLTEKAAKKWGTKQLPRYRGLGQVAEGGFVNNQWLDGQLIIIGEEYFSFAWVPIEHQIFFGRPSPELALKMLKDGGVSTLKGKTWKDRPTLDDDVATLKDYATHILEVTTETIEEELNGEPFGCIWHDEDTEECYFQ